MSRHMHGTCLTRASGRTPRRLTTGSQAVGRSLRRRRGTPAASRAHLCPSWLLDHAALTSKRRTFKVGVRPLSNQQGSDPSLLFFYARGAHDLGVLRLFLAQERRELGRREAAQHRALLLELAADLGRG